MEALLSKLAVRSFLCELVVWAGEASGEPQKDDRLACLLGVWGGVLAMSGWPAHALLGSPRQSSLPKRLTMSSDDEEDDDEEDEAMRMVRTMMGMMLRMMLLMLVVLTVR